MLKNQNRTEAKTSPVELTLEELEALVSARRCRARARFLRRLAAEGRTWANTGETGMGPCLTLGLMGKGDGAGGFAAIEIKPFTGRLRRGLACVRAMGRSLWPWSWAQVLDGALLAVEIAALVGLLIVLGVSLIQLRLLNEGFAQAQADTLTAPVTPVSGEAVLPGGHVPPRPLSQVLEPYLPRVRASAPGAVLAPPPDVPPHRSLALDRPSSEQGVSPSSPAATRIVIPAIDVDAPVLEGDSWEVLKQGVGHHPGSAQPGEGGNVVLSGHNDVFSQVFRRLEELAPGDEILLYAGDRPYRYTVVDKRVVAPTEVSVMAPTAEPTLTLITCYPYLIDTHRIVVIAHLME
ncbi:MAG: sortase [Anaerolineae bacterium]